GGAGRAVKELKGGLKANRMVQATVVAARAAYEKAKLELDDAATKAEKQLAVALAAKVTADITKATNDLTKAEGDMKGSNGLALDPGAYEGKEEDKTGLYALDKADLFNLLCIPPDTRAGDTPTSVLQTAM